MTSEPHVCGGTRHRRAGAVVIAAAITFAAACAGPTSLPGQPSAGAPSSESPRVPPGEATLPDMAGSFRQYLLGELGDSYLELGRIEHDRREDLTAACLADAGFDYMPRPHDPAAERIASVAELLEQRRAAGYGVFPGNREVAEPSRSDPNEDYLRTLTPEAHQEYLAAQLECNVEVEDEVASTSADHVFGDLWTELRRGEQLVDQDPDVLATVEAWSACMADAGYPGLVHLGAVYDLVEARRLAEFPAAMADEDPRVVELAAWEREVGAIDADCHEVTGAYAARIAFENAWQRETMARRTDDVAAYVEALRAELEP